MSTPSSPFYTSAWGCEQEHISDLLEDMKAAPPPFAKKTDDGLNDIISLVDGSHYSIMINHEHVKRALDMIKGYPYPTSFEHYCKVFRFREWDIVCKTMLVAIRLKVLEPNSFQRFMLGIYIHEYAPHCCCKCGLTLGYWCGEYFLINWFIDFTDDSYRGWN